jgi:hypothetical protein
MNEKYFLTVDWCSKGRRGIFCSRDGIPFSKKTKHTKEEMDDVLGLFSLVLSPESILMTEEKVRKHTRFYPLGEYNGQFGYAVVPEIDNLQP